MHGILNLCKPVGITSAKAVYRVRKITRQRRSGHGGTLDPLATGVLLVFLGRATKLVEQLMDYPKVYRVQARLDVTNVGYDAELPLEPVPVQDIPTAAQVAAALAGFEGEIEQVPPALSAVKIDGQRAYKRMRRKNAEIVQPPARPVRIDWVLLHAYRWPEIDFELCCGRGTYVRSLIRDLGEHLGVGGCLTGLRRTQVGPFRAADGWSFPGLEEAASVWASTPEAARARTMQAALQKAYDTSTEPPLQPEDIPPPPYILPLADARDMLRKPVEAIPRPAV